MTVAPVVSTGATTPIWHLVHDPARLNGLINTDKICNFLPTGELAVFISSPNKLPGATTWAPAASVLYLFDFVPGSLFRSLIWSPHIFICRRSGPTYIT